MEYEQILRLVTESAKLEMEEGVVRPLELELERGLGVAKLIRVLTGLRRAGKSYLLKRMYRKLLGDGVDRRNILFVNFESDLLAGKLNLDSLRDIYEVFATRAQPGRMYLFLDEIQNVSRWESFVRTIYDSTDNAIYLTGSNSQMLSSEIGTALGGRTLTYFVLPFSLGEFLDAKKIKRSTEFERAENRIRIAGAVEEYLKFGGFPETFGLTGDGKLNYRSGLVEKIMVNDLISRFKLEYPGLLKDLLRFCELNIGNLTSIRNLTNVVKNQRQEGVGDEKTVGVYMEYLEKTYLLRPVYKFSLKTKEVLQSQKKYYMLDNLFSYYCDKEDRLENAIYHHLVRKYGVDSVFFGRDERGREVDFVVRRLDGEIEGVQACWELNENNFKREFGALKILQKSELKIADLRLVVVRDAMKSTKGKNGVVSVTDELLGVDL